MLNDLERAVLAKNILVNSISKHKEKTKEIAKRRNALLMKMTLCEENSIQYEDIERQIEILDKQEYDLHAKFKKVLQSADKEINGAIERIMERHKESHQCRDSSSSNAPDHEFDAAQEVEHY